MKNQIVTHNAPAAIGPYSQAIHISNMIFVSGQLPIDPVSGIMASDVASQTRQSLQNIKAILTQANCSMDNVVKTTVFLSNMDDFSAMNNIYEQFFSSPYPARAAVEVVRLPKNALVEIEAIAAYTQP